MDTVIEYIGPAALLEQTAEECAELAKACLKLARKMRGENPTPVAEEVLFKNLNEEIADVKLCMGVIMTMGISSESEVNPVIDRKLDRWKERLSK